MISQLAVAVGGARQVAAKAGVEGNAYENPTFGWTDLLGRDLESSKRTSEEDNYELLELSDNLSFVFFESYAGYEGDPVACIEDEEKYLSSARRTIATSSWRPTRTATR